MQKSTQISLLSPHIFICLFWIVLSAPSPAQDMQFIDYKLPAQINPLILTDRPTEIWGRIYFNPQSLSTKRPLILILHGNHPTCIKINRPNSNIDEKSCDYTVTGECPEGFKVIENHLGYEYLAQEFVKQNFIVASISANRGINCSFKAESDIYGNTDWSLNLARGRLILSHLDLLNSLNTSTVEKHSTDIPESLMILKDQIDFKNVGLIGHSRGGEGIRAAYNYFKTPRSLWRKKLKNLSLKGLFEIAPVDRQAPVVLTPDSVLWTTLLPLCDGDVPNLNGMHVFDRFYTSSTFSFSEEKLLPKSVLKIHGANHNSFNTNWGISDSFGCRDQFPLFPLIGRSFAQEKILKFFTSQFFGFAFELKTLTQFEDVYSPHSYQIPKEINEITHIERDYLRGAHGDYFTLEAGFSEFNKNFVNSNLDFNIVTLPHHGPSVIMRSLETKTASDQNFFQWNPEERSFISPYTHLELRIALIRSNDKSFPFDFSLQLANKDNQLSEPLKLSSYYSLYPSPSLSELLQIVRIPIADFKHSGDTDWRGLRLTFNISGPGLIYLSAPKFSANEKTSTPSDVTNKNFMYHQRAFNPVLMNPHQSSIDYAVYKKCHPHFEKQTRSTDKKDLICLEVESSKPFEPKADELVAKTGYLTTKRIVHSPTGDLKKIQLFLTVDEWEMFQRQGKIDIGYTQSQGVWRLIHQ